jgi:ABC-type transport system involved in cytochrome bd biosynthesis fused ATPase/permease subunit
MSFKLPKFLYVSLPYIYMVGGALIVYVFRGFLGGWITGVIGMALAIYGFAVLMLRKDFRVQDQSDAGASRYDDSRYDDIRVQSSLISSKASENKGPPARKKS